LHKSIQRNIWLVPDCELAKEKSSALYLIDDSCEEITNAVQLSDKYRNGSRVCIQAGGCIGLWPALLSRYFEDVYTFEPDSLNYECMKYNLAGINNIHHQQAALGTKPGQCTIQRKEKYENNCVAGQVIDGNDVDVITIDSLNLNHVDLIWLDIEGYEVNALQGAIETIKRCRPVIGVEDYRHWKDYGNIEPQNWLARKLNYRSLGKVSKHDQMLIPIERYQ